MAEKTQQNNLRPLLLPAVFKKYGRKADMSMTFSIESSLEVKNEDVPLIDQYYGKPGWFMFSPNEPNYDDLPKDDAPKKKQETPSQHLRNCLFALWKKKVEGTESFDAYYERQMAKFANMVKDKMED